MYYGSELPILAGILSLIILVVFFIMAIRIGRINRTLLLFREIALRDPANWIETKCDHCNHSYKLPLDTKENVNCPKCKNVHTVTKPGLNR